MLGMGTVGIGTFSSSPRPVGQEDWHCHQPSISILEVGEIRYLLMLTSQDKPSQASNSKVQKNSDIVIVTSCNLTLLQASARDVSYLHSADILIHEARTQEKPLPKPTVCEEVQTTPESHTQSFLTSDGR